MSRRHYALPPLTSLAAFESAARNLSFKNAAQELSVTPGAVSHQVKSLEIELGTALFVRLHRGVELTPAGQRLQNTLSDAFGRMASGVRAAQSEGDDRPVVVGATSAVASLLLTPSVARFWRQYGDVPVNQITSDRGFDQSAGLDFFIRYGRDVNPKLDHSELFRDCLVPVAGKASAAEAGNPSLRELASMRLIHLDSGDKTWTSWEAWFAALGHDGPIARGIRVNNYTIALQAAQDDAGVALGWRRLIRPLLKRGALARIGDRGLTSPERFYVVSRPVSELTENARKLRQWILADVASDEFK